MQLKTGAQNVEVNAASTRTTFEYYKLENDNTEKPFKMSFLARESRARQTAAFGRR